MYMCSRLSLVQWNRWLKAQPGAGCKTGLGSKLFPTSSCEFWTTRVSFQCTGLDVQSFAWRNRCVLEPYRDTVAWCWVSFRCSGIGKARNAWFLCPWPSRMTAMLRWTAPVFFKMCCVRFAQLLQNIIFYVHTYIYIYIYIYTYMHIIYIYIYIHI